MSTRWKYPLKTSNLAYAECYVCKIDLADVEESKTRPRAFMRSAGGIHVLRKGRFRLDGGVLVITLISLHGKVVAVELSSAAATALARRSPPLIAEVHLIFSCMVAKRFWFSEKLRPNARPVTDGLSICFRGVRYDRACRIDGADAGALSSDYPLVADKGCFVPDIVAIYFRAGRWFGDFTYDPEAACTHERIQRAPPSWRRSSRLSEHQG